MNKILKVKPINKLTKRDKEFLRCMKFMAKNLGYYLLDIVTKKNDVYALVLTMSPNFRDRVGKIKGFKHTFMNYREKERNKNANK